ncbi:delta endotoxin C-terminal domain-containing protein, partial [Bacillus cereus]|uniref:delta endotoxin C-terminal domain-containing protein n=2 Tax=Bacillus cereus TaxID=1396 RepID=UPI000C036002
VVPEWTTGSNVVQLPPGQTITVPIFNIIEGQYTMRVNYACNANVDMAVNIETGTGNSVFSNTLPFSATNSNDFPGKNGYYRNQLITDTLDMGTFSMTIDHIQLTNKGTSDIFLDRVEFIPAASDTAQTGTFIVKEVTISNNQQPITLYDGETIYNTIQLGSSLNNITFQFYKNGFLVDTFIPTANTSLSQQVPTGFDRIEVTTSNPNETVVDILAHLTLDSTLDPSRPLPTTINTDITLAGMANEKQTVYKGVAYTKIELTSSVGAESRVQYILSYQGEIVDILSPKANVPITKLIPTGFDEITINNMYSLWSGKVHIQANLTFPTDLAEIETINIGNIEHYLLSGRVFWNNIWNASYTSYNLTGNVDAYSYGDLLVQFYLDDTLIHTDSIPKKGEPIQIQGTISPFNNIAFGEVNGGFILFSYEGTLSGGKLPTTAKLHRQADLSNVTSLVQGLFQSSDQMQLNSNIDDYWIDQMVLKVDALSDEVFGKEKKALRKVVNKAKQLSKARNLLIGGSFDTLAAWQLGKKVIRREDGDLFKGEHLLLPPPTVLSPSYAYQKIDESKLKAYTRYTVSGFVAQGDPLEVVVSRYGKEIEKTLHVPYEEAHPITSEPTPNCCMPGTPSSCNGETPDSHFFHYNIDVGALQTEANLGISLGLRIGETATNTLGLARIGNLEIREERPLTAREIRKVQKVEKKWKKEWEQKRADVTAKLQPVIDQINALYVNNDWNGLVRP